MKKLLFVIMSAFALLIGIYPLIYVFVEHRHTFLGSKSSELLQSLIWRLHFLRMLFLVGWLFLQAGVSLEIHSGINISGFTKVLEKSMQLLSS
jgi:hypothetical protein